VHQQGADRVATQAARVLLVMPVGEEFSRRRVEAVESSTISPEPKSARPVFADCRHLVIRKAVGIFGIVLIRSPLIGFPIQPINAVLRPHPKKSFAILPHGPDHVVTQTVRISGLMLVGDKSGSLLGEPAYAVVRSNPNRTFRVLEHSS